MNSLAKGLLKCFAG
ncbi:hypothetical protein AB3S75_015720 [Citrus x aurantiifolia]